jgi:hypothetical protein
MIDSRALANTSIAWASRRPRVPILQFVSQERKEGKMLIKRKPESPGTTSFIAVVLNGLIEILMKERVHSALGREEMREVGSSVGMMM